MLRLRAIEPSDAELFFSVENDESSWTSSDTVAPWSRHALRRYAESYVADPFTEGQLRLIAEDDREGVIGILDFYELSSFHSHSWLGIYILPEMRRKGYCTRLLDMAAAYAADRLGLRVLGARILEENQPSLKAFRKAGFRHCGVLPSWHFGSGRRHDIHILTMTL